MNKVQVAKLNSYTVLQGLLGKWEEVVGTLPEYEMRAGAFDLAVSVIVSITPQREYANSAEMDKYKSDRQELVNACSTLSKKLVIHADSTGNEALRNDVKYTKAELRRTKKSKLLNLANLMVERATKVLPNATSAKLTQGDIDAVKVVLAATMKSKDALRNQQLKTRNDSRQISEAFTKADVALDKLFLTLDLLSDSHPLLYKQLEDATRLIYAYQTLSVRGSVAEAKTEYPIKGAKVIIRRIGDSAPADLMIEAADVEKVTTEIGGFQVKSLLPGTYLLTASKPGYNTANIQFTVASTETTKVSVLMGVA